MADRHVCNICPDPAADRYLQGPRCARHTPRAIAGLAELPAPDPTRTLAALRSAQAAKPAPKPIEFDPALVHWVTIPLRTFGTNGSRRS